jgi:hypothetical protein
VYCVSKDDVCFSLRPGHVDVDLDVDAGVGVAVRDERIGEHVQVPICKSLNSQCLMKMKRDYTLFCCVCEGCLNASAAADLHMTRRSIGGR